MLGKTSSAQTASELAIFGAILIMVIGTLVSYSLLFNYSQNFQMLAFRQALKESHEIDWMSASVGPPLARRTASVVIIQDRNMPDLSSAFGIMSRSASGSSASATYNRHLSAEMEYNEPTDLPTVDFFINNQHFSFTTANYESVPCGTYNTNPLCPGSAVSHKWKRKVFMGSEEFNDSVRTNYDDRFFGTTFVGSSIDDIWWKWYFNIDCLLHSYPPFESANMVMDVDCDGKEEQVINPITLTNADCCKKGTQTYDANCCPITELQVLDFQEGEIDFTVNSYDISKGAKTQGLLAEGSAEYHVEPGTQLVKGENASQITTTTTVKRTDIITRIIRLNPRHTDWTRVISQAEKQAKCRTTNAKQTCFELNDSIVGGPALFIRSNLKTDKPPQKWTIAK